MNASKTQTPVAPVAVPQQAKRVLTASRREALTAVLFASPWIIGFCVFLLYPLLASVYYSFCDYSVLRPPVWIGLANYTSLLHDDVFKKTLQNTGMYAPVSLILGLIMALAMAMLLNTKVRGLTLYRTMFYLPSLVPMVALACLWLWLFNGENGLVNQALTPLLHPFGLKPPNWLNDSAWSKPALILIGLWGTGNAMVIYLAGLQDVPVPLYEAAELDGAGWWAKTWNVTLPMLSPVILFNLIMGIIGSLQVFTIPYVMFPGGSPSRSTYFYTMYLYDNAFKYGKMGLACAMGWIMFVIILCLTLAALKISNRHVHYSGS